jgi:hypothetical protein
MKTKENIASDLENKMEDEMSNVGVFSQGIEGMMAANDFKNSLGEEKNKKTDMIKKSIKQGVSDKLVSKTKLKKPVSKLTSSLPIMGENGETDESTGSGSAGGFSTSLFSTTKKEMEENCRKGYKEIGGKKKNGKTVPNCVPVKEGVKEKDKEKKYLDIEDMIPELKKQLNKGTRLDKDTKKVEATEATGSGSSGQYSTTAAWAKSTSKKDWMGKSKPQIPGGKFVQVKKKCKKFPYCNQGDIKALKIYENETVKKAIKNISERHNISENVIKSIISYEYEKLKSNK